MEDKAVLMFKNIKKRNLILFVLIFLFCLSNTVFAGSGWLIYHKPAFKGKVIDAETKESIEGAVVVAVYSKQAIRIAPESVSIIVDVKETLTDKEGNFYIPSYTTIIDPLSWEDLVTFIIFKPCYGNFPDYQRVPSGIKRKDHEIFFSIDNFKKEGELELWVKERKRTELYKFKLTFGIVELPKLKTKEERLKAMPSPVEDSEHKSTWYWKKQKQFIRLLNEENRNLGLTGEYKIED